MPRLSFFLFTPAVLGLALTSGGCDRQSEAPAQPAANEAATNLRAIDRSHAGSRAPDFTFSTPDGRQLRLPELAGRAVLLNLWATWCAPCVKEMPLLDQLADAMEGQLRVVTVSQDMQGADAVAPFFAEKGFRHLEPWLDPESDLAFHYGGANLPTSVLYDAQGREVWRLAGDFDWSSEEARALIAEGLSPAS